MPQPPIEPFATHPTPRKPWTFDHVHQENPDNRQAKALEYIAMYLDRIETHLATIAANSERGATNSAAIAPGIPGLIRALGEKK